MKEITDPITPQEIKRLQARSGLSNVEVAAWLMVSEKRLMNAKSENSKSPLSPQQLQLLKLIADEHPDYKLLKRK
ncbi:XRE family transcriptional regulator [Serratia symbiotica]|uniref:XRE family transcriptional regulator n=1 Tax=Serratia symbiotica TaxID=138074 RepID=UPI001328BD32|nr:XRE family transcriptional regulator [Serratia symbiotica]QTP13384.1 XRE family transcriptional regulator [Serratia symbiotica]